ncbi:MAG: HDIG domain-containing protein [Bacteroidales bacterium]|nr:HDIG domain-containing protein [Bacteroidales bacterium]
MNQQINFLRKHAIYLFRISLFLLSVVLIMFIFPREGKFKYEFQRGKPWMHEDLIASFDFPILKPANEISQERELVIRQIKPYFRFNNQQLSPQRSQVIQHLQSKLQTPSGRLPAGYETSKKQALEVFDKVHERGIIEMNPMLEGRPSDFQLMVIKENTANEVEMNKLFTIQTADLWVRGQLKSLNNAVNNEILAVIISNHLIQNVFYDQATTEHEKQNALARISQARGMIQKGERIISEGELVTAEKLLILESFRKEYETQVGSTISYLGIIAGQSILVTISLAVLLLFLIFFRPDLFMQNKNIVFILLVILLMVFTISFVVRNHLHYFYLLPVCLVPVLIRVFYDTRLALFVHLVVIIITGFLVPNSFEFVFLQLIAGIIAIISVVKVDRRGLFVLSAFLIFITYSAIYTGMNLMQEGNFSTIGTTNYLLFGGSALLTLLAYPLIFIFEKAFGFVTDITLLELSDTNNKLLRKLGERAPGTFQHSIQLANIAEEVVREIGGNPLLVRAGALYHDIGKADMPVYFIENQTTGVNPHDDLPYEESARIIISHVPKGIDIARKHKLPEAIIDFIRTHHGTKKAEYFFTKHLEDFPDEETNEETFTYHGPAPFSKETAVVMMADSVEAASRSLKMPDPEKINNLVETIINKQLAEGQYDNADITMRDIYRIKKILKKKLMNIYHVRISYS